MSSKLRTFNFCNFSVSPYSSNLGNDYLPETSSAFSVQDIGRVAGPPILNPIANEVYLNFESSTPCLADRHFNYTSLITFHCKRGVSMVSGHRCTRHRCAGRPARAGGPRSLPRTKAARVHSACLAPCAVSGVWNHCRPSV